MLKKIANTVRGLSADAVQKANSGHPGMPIGCADIGALLYGEVMKHDPQKPDWLNRDRFVLSAGHGSMLIYSLLHLSGYDLSQEDLKKFRTLGSKTPGHPEYGLTPGVETTTGPLGQGIANAVGMALAERMMAARYNTEAHNIIDHFTYTILGDGCMMEGISCEAASLAGHLGLGKLIAIYDDNDISIEGSTDITFSDSVSERFKAQNWHVIENVDGHDIEELRNAINKAKEIVDKPTLIIANTHIAYQSPEKEDSSAAHGAPLGEEEIKGLKKNISLPVDEKFYIADDVKEYFAKRKSKLQKARKEWEQKYEKWKTDNPQLKERFVSAQRLELPADLRDIIDGIELDTPLATRKSSGAILREIASKVPYLVGGSADLAPSNKTYLDDYKEVQKKNFTGRNFRFGVREHAMGAIANGISLYGGLRPFVATFLTFTDYMKSAIRLAALMNQPVIYVLTHDSIYIGEDGPTHQPVEQTESLRLIPNLQVIRPADEEETKIAWIRAMERTDGPTALIFTRQNLAHINKDKGLENCYRGGYIVKGEEAEKADIVLIASGSEVSLAVKVAEGLKDANIASRIVSVPDRGQFMANKKSYIEKVLGPKDTMRVVLEAGIGQGWYQLLGENHHLVSVEEFGTSAPGNEVAKEFGFTAEAVIDEIMDKI